VKRGHFPLYLALAALVLMLIVVVGQPARRPIPLTTNAAGQPTTRALAGGQALRGLAMELYNIDRRYRYERELDELAAMQAQVVCFSVRGWQEDVNSSRVFIDHAAMPTEEALVAVMKRARTLGMQVVLLPIVLLRDTNSTEDWRGVISPHHWDRWWESYERFIVYYARLAEEAGAEMFSVGSELIGTEHMSRRWRKVIRAVRDVYTGKVLYSANWDHYVEVSFWDDLDLIGMTAYHTLAKDRSPTIEDLRRNWQPIKQAILDWQREQGKQIVFTEVGFPSQDGCAREPWNYYGSTVYDPQEQYVCLQAFFEAWRDEPAVAAITIWKWEDRTDSKDLGYTPKGKPSEALLRRWLLGGPLTGIPTSAPSARKRQGPPWHPGLSRGVFQVHPACGRPTVAPPRRVGVGATAATPVNRVYPRIRD